MLLIIFGLRARFVLTVFPRAWNPPSHFILLSYYRLCEFFYFVECTFSALQREADGGGGTRLLFLG